MPHQCLNCGDAFEEGSTDLLEGCPSCEGTRFFYTEEPLEEDEREELQEDTDDDVESMLQDIVDEEDQPDLAEDIWSREAWEQWIRDKASSKADADDTDVSFEEIADAVKQRDEGPSTAPEAGPPGGEPDTHGFETADPEASSEEADPVQVELGDVQETTPPTGETEGPPEQEAAREALQPAPQPGDDGRPSTLNINDPGEYEIDVRRLLEDSPVIVERDGSYVIHLPSVFDREQ
jgi:predicted  nucleic acid-binding Zn-ribbon protein